MVVQATTVCLALVQTTKYRQELGNVIRYFNRMKVRGISIEVKMSSMIVRNVISCHQAKEMSKFQSCIFVLN